MGNIDVTGAHVMVTSYQDVSAPIPVGESTCGGLVDVDQDDKSSTDKQMTR